VERKLAAILCADVYGYSRLMGDNEEATLHTLTSHRKLIDSAIDQHHGRFVNSAGDSVLAEFASVVEAVNCAVDIQTGLKTENANLPAERRMEFRIGVNLGDVMVEGAQIYGDGVNVAARLESLSEPGGICISGTAHDQVRRQAGAGLRRCGRAGGQEYRASGARLAGTVERCNAGATEDATDSAEISAGRNTVVGGPRDSYRDDSDRSACVA
jgi:adenylate cyclase